MRNRPYAAQPRGHWISLRVEPDPARKLPAMAPPMKITDLTSIEGDPDPERADVPDPRMYLEMRASGPWQLGLVKFIARCSERAPVARALVVWLLTAAGIALAAAAHYLLPAHHSGWLAVVVLVICLLLPFGMYQVMGYDPRRRLRRKSLPS